MDKLTELENRIAQLESITLVKRIAQVNDTEITRVIGSDGGNTFDFPDMWLHLEFNGKFYRVPAYDLSRFAI